jgi:hypothetical protein
MVLLLLLATEEGKERKK